MKLFFVCITTILTIESGRAQTPGWQWVKNGGGDGYPGSSPSNQGKDVITSHAIDKDGNIIVAGYCSWSPVFDTINFPNISGNTSWEDQNFFIAKYSNCGDVLWVNVGGGKSGESIQGMDVDERGNVYAFAVLNATGIATARIIAQDKDTIISNTFSSFLKFDPDGNLLFVRNYGQSPIWLIKQGMFRKLNSSQILSIVEVSSGSVNIGGYVAPNNSSNLILLDTTGAIIKGKVIDTLLNVYNLIYDMVIDKEDKIYLSYGNYSSPQVTLLGTPISPAPTFSFFLLKTDSSFNLLNVNTSGANNNAALSSLATDGTNLYASDRSPNNSSFDGDTVHTTFPQILNVYKIDSNLHKVWASRPSYFSNAPQDFLKNVPVNNSVFAGTLVTGTTVWGGDTIINPPFTYTPTIFNLSAIDGSCQEIFRTQPTTSSTIYDEIGMMNADKNGSVYLMGNFANRLAIPIDTVVANGGTNSPDYFILKWGLSCTDTVPTVVCSSSITRTNTDSLYTFNANATGTGGLSYQWSNNGNAFSTAASPTLVLDNVGSYTICVTVTDANNCVTTDCDTVTITAFTCSTTINAQNTDSAYSFTTTNVGAGPFSYAWSNNGTAFSSSATANLVLNLAGTYNICVTVTGSNNCQSNDCYSVTITTPPVCSTTVSYTLSDTTYNFTTTNTGTAPYTYEWTLNGQVWSSSAAPATALSSGSNNICVSVTDGLNCKSSDCETVVVSGISENVIELIELYPNPVQDQLYIGALLQTDSRAEIVLYDLSGRMVMSWQKQIIAGKNLLVLDVSHLANGVYELQLKTRNEKWRGRIVKN